LGVSDAIDVDYVRKLEAEVARLHGIIDKLGELARSGDARTVQAGVIFASTMEQAKEGRWGIEDDGFVLCQHCGKRMIRECAKCHDLLVRSEYDGDGGDDVGVE
jgi:hypothetical protein